MLDALVGFLVITLVVAGVLVIIGPNLRGLMKRVRAIRPPARLPSPPIGRGSREVSPAGLNPKTQRVLVGSARLANWLRTNGQDELAREVRTGAARMATNEAAGLYALLAVLRKVRGVSPDDSAGADRLRSLADELRAAVQDRGEQLELLPFGRRS